MIRRLAALALLAAPLAGCGGPSGVLFVDPTAIDWGQVDFQAALPDDGYDARSIEVRNDGDKPIDVELVGFDTERLILGALLATEDPPTIPTLEPGDSQLLTVGVGDYADGERDTVVTGNFSFTSADLEAPIEVSWIFEPIRDISDDTGF